MQTPVTADENLMNMTGCEVFKSCIINNGFYR